MVDREVLAERLAQAAGLRTILVHVYVGIDHEMIYEILQRDLDDLVSYAEALGRLGDSGG